MHDSLFLYCRCCPVFYDLGPLRLSRPEFDGGARQDLANYGGSDLTLTVHLRKSLTRGSSPMPPYVLLGPRGTQTCGWP